MSNGSSGAVDIERQRWMGVLACARRDELSDRLRTLGTAPAFTWLRPPEQGSVMVRGRAGGDGTAFSLGEMTVTRCSVRLDDGRVGHAWVQGRDADHARDAALVDALMQSPDAREELEREVIAPLVAARLERQRTAAMQTEATRVDFFTLVRGHEKT